MLWDFLRQLVFEFGVIYDLVLLSGIGKSVDN